MNTAGIRKAALAIATMHPTDQRWMLAQVPRAWRVVLVPLLVEARRFTSLGTDLLQTVLDDAGQDLMVEVPAPAALIAIVNELPSAWAACVLVAAAPDHVEIYLAACDHLRGEAVRHEIGRLPHPFPRALAGAIVRHLNDVDRALRSSEAVR